MLAYYQVNERPGDVDLARNGGRVAADAVAAGGPPGAPGLALTLDGAALVEFVKNGGGDLLQASGERCETRLGGAWEGRAGVVALHFPPSASRCRLPQPPKVHHPPLMPSLLAQLWTRAGPGRPWAQASGAPLAHARGPPVADLLASFLAARAQDRLVDFDDHLGDPSLDWLNPGLLG